MTLKTEVEPHEIEWTPERVSRFWDYLSSNPAMEESYFAHMAGESLLAFVKKRIPIGLALDIGCGRGHLIGHLVKAGYRAYGADGSPASVAAVRKKFETEPGFLGAVDMKAGRVDLPDQTADTAFVLEVVEHMDDEALGAMLAEAHRLLKPGGHLVLTTPNEENLDASRLMCPECGGIFHRVQHVRAWSADTLQCHVEPFGFTTASCHATVLSPYQGALGVLYRRVYPIVRGRRPHLIYIGRKG